MVLKVATVKSAQETYSIHGNAAPAMGAKSFRKLTDKASPALESVRTDLSKFSDPESSRLFVSAKKSVYSFCASAVGVYGCGLSAVTSSDLRVGAMLAEGRVAA
jgi:hypothetical protein